ncbi:MAG: hypothetical protein M1541_20400, partial [Acidobacteria bacterium]|nr:hypothetical protein [Acidobacteriota bacterium]
MTRRTFLTAAGGAVLAGSGHTAPMAKEAGRLNVLFVVGVMLKVSPITVDCTRGSTAGFDVVS